jgi:hypothetical protein
MIMFTILIMAVLRRRSSLRRFAAIALGGCAFGLLTPTAGMGVTIGPGHTLCGAPQDTVPPRVLSISLPRHPLDVLHGAKGFDIRLHAVDTSDTGPGSGVGHLQFRLTPTFGGNWGWSPEFHLRSGTPDDGIWVAHVKLDRWVPRGRYWVWVHSIIATDRSGNSTRSGEWGYGVPAGIHHPVVIEGKSAQAVEAHNLKQSSRQYGRLKSFTMTPNPVNALAPGAAVVLTARFADPQPVGLATDLGGPQLPMHRRQNGSWRATFHPLPWLGSTYHLGVFLWDRFGVVRHSARTLVIKGGVDDTPPVLTSLSVSPSTVDTTTKDATVSFEATAKDPTNPPAPTSGIASQIGVYLFDLPTGPGQPDPVDELFLWLNRVGSSDEYDGTIVMPACSAGGEFQIMVALEDGAGNRVDWSGAQLTAIGAPTQITNTSTATPAEATNPTFSDASAGSATGVITAYFAEGVEHVTQHNLVVLEDNASHTRIPIESVSCFNAVKASTLCDGSTQPVTSVAIQTAGLQAGVHVRLLANQDWVRPQITDMDGNPFNWDCRELALHNGSQPCQGLSDLTPH